MSIIIFKSPYIVKHFSASTKPELTSQLTSAPYSNKSMGTTGKKGWRRQKFSNGLRLVQDTTTIDSWPTSKGKFNFYFTLRAKQLKAI